MTESSGHAVSATHACQGCAAVFKPVKRRHVYCSKPCQVRARNARNRVVQEERACAEYGDKFHSRRTNHTYCNRLCSDRGHRRLVEAGQAPETADCSACGSPFRVRCVGHLHCSPRCRATARRLRVRPPVKTCRACTAVKSRSEFTHDEWSCDGCVAPRSAGMHRCSRCGDTKPATEFYRATKTRAGIQSRCRSCAQEAERIRALDPAEKRRARSNRLLRSFGITADQFDELLAAQGGRCALCGDEPGTESMHVDHDHRCCPGQRTCGSCIRGICCPACNQALGFLKDSPGRALAAARYLQSHQREDP